MTSSYPRCGWHHARHKAIDSASVVLYGISAAYKVSANCRLEANYAHQQKKRMLPMMLQEGYNPTGWLGMFLGTRLWCGVLLLCFLEPACGGQIAKSPMYLL